MALDSKATSVEYLPYGDFRRPDNFDERSLRHYIPIYLNSFNLWLIEAAKENGVSKAGAQARIFDYYLKTAFARASKIGLADDLELARLREEYRREREMASRVLTLEDLAA